MACWGSIARMPVRVDLPLKHAGTLTLALQVATYMHTCSCSADSLATPARWLQYEGMRVKAFVSCTHQLPNMQAESGH